MKIVHARFLLRKRRNACEQSRDQVTSKKPKINNEEYPMQFISSCHGCCQHLYNVKNTIPTFKTIMYLDI